MDIQRLQSRIIQATVIYSILPAFERSDGVLLESISIYGMLPVKRVGPQDRDRGFVQHYDIIDKCLSVVEKCYTGMRQRVSLNWRFSPDVSANHVDLGCRGSWICKPFSDSI